jgi:hypothetical protein
MADRFFIAPYAENSGLQTNLKPWLIPDEAFSELNNAYVFRGRVRKRFGSRWTGGSQFSSRLRINIGTITGGTLSGNVRTILADAGMPTSVGQSFSIGTIVFTIFNPSSGPQQMLRTDNSATATFNLTNSDFNITSVVQPDGTAVYFYPSFPVMGLPTYEQIGVSNEYVIAFDTRYAYKYSPGGWNRISAETTPGAAVWTGNNTQFFWATTWIQTGSATKVFFVTNFNQNEPNFMRYFNGTAWNNFMPILNQISAGPDVFNYLFSARIIVLFKNRLLAFNTWEGSIAPGINYNNRFRYSQYGSPLNSDSWRKDIPGKGGGINIPTTESIITVEFVKDRLIVFCERSTWEVVFTGNQAFPFQVQQINTELGAESTFSIVPFDKICLGIGNTGIHACNGSNVQRIDEKIPDTVFSIHQNGQGVERVYGIRDYYVEMVYWTFPSTKATTDFPYCNKVLIFNYKTGTWAFNDDSITAFGYFQPNVGVTWSSTTVTWDDTETWDSGAVQALFRQVLAGNQQGYVFLCDADAQTNAPVIQITNITTTATLTTLIVIQHNFTVGDYIYIQDITWSDASNALNNAIFQITNVIDSNTFNIVVAPVPPYVPITGVYSGGGLISRVSKISISTKEYNFYSEQGRNASVNKIDFMVDKTSAGQIQVDFFASTSVVSLLKDSQPQPSGSGSLLGTGTLDTFPYPDIPFESDTSRLWHPVYFQADGEVIQFQLVMNDAQMRDINVRQSGFALHAMCIYAQPTSYRFQ